jgi:acyl carrier protein
MAVDEHWIHAARDLIARALAQSPASIARDGSIHTVPAWDSLGHVRVILAIESRIGGTLPSEVIAAIASVADIATILAESPTKSE